MKYLRRYLSLLFALVMCVGLFSVTAHANENIAPSLVNFTRTTKLSNSWNSTTYTYCYTNADPVGYVDETIVTANKGIPPGTTNVTVWDFFKVDPYNEPGEDAILIPKGGLATLSLYNIYLNIGVDYSGGFFYSRDIEFVTALVQYMDDSYEYVGGMESITNNSGVYDFTFSITPKKDIKYIEFQLKRSIYVDPVSGHTNIHIYSGVPNELVSVNISQSSEEAGLLKGISNILNNVKDGISNVVNGILELPQKLWNLISDGLKSLFVPSEESMTAFKDKWDELLSSRFGAVYQVVNIMTDSWDGIMQADETDIIDFPQASINFSGTPFVFGGYSVKIVPDGFGVLVTAIKTIVAIVCTVAFVNGMRKRYDEIMGVEQ